MFIKEYRIPLPLSVEEYKIAQLYMIAKKSREESKVRRLNEENTLKSYFQQNEVSGMENCCFML